MQDLQVLLVAVPTCLIQAGVSPHSLLQFPQLGTRTNISMSWVKSLASL